MLISYRDYYGTLHHHKEQMAYTATAFYLTAASILITQAQEVSRWAIPPCLLVFLIELSAVVGAAFIVWQLRQRETAADIVLACTKLLAKGIKIVVNDTMDYKYKKTPFPKQLVEELNIIDKERRFLEGPRVSEAITYIVIYAWTNAAFWSLCHTCRGGYFAFFGIS